MSETKYEVSDKFIWIYRRMHVKNLVEDMKQLDKRELYLLLLRTLDDHDLENESVMANMRAFKAECLEIFAINDGKETSCPVLAELKGEDISKTLINLHMTDRQGVVIGSPLTRDEIRDEKISDIIDDGDEL